MNGSTSGMKGCESFCVISCSYFGKGSTRPMRHILSVCQLQRRCFRKSSRLAIWIKSRVDVHSLYHIIVQYLMLWHVVIWYVMLLLNVVLWYVVLCYINYTCVCVYIHIYIYIYTRMCVSIYMYLYIYIYIFCLTPSACSRWAWAGGDCSSACPGWPVLWVCLFVYLSCFVYVHLCAMFLVLVVPLLLLLMSCLIVLLILLIVYRIMLLCVCLFVVFNIG